MISTKALASIVLMAVHSALAGQVPKSACGAPSYKIARNYSRPGEVAIAVSVRPREATVRSLIALACQFRTHYANVPVVVVEVFNDYEAAKRTTNLHGVEYTAPQGSNKAAYIANYYLDYSKGKESLTLVVDPDHPCDKDIDIDLKNRKLSFFSCR